MLLKSTEYAIRALVFVQLRNKGGKRPGVSEIAKEIEAPVAYSAKILQTLTKHKLLDSSKGRGGGFFFSGNQSNLSLFDIINVMEGNSCFHKCVFGLKECNNDNPCPVHDKYTTVREGFYEIVKSETIKSLSDKILNGTAVLSRIV